MVEPTATSFTRVAEGGSEIYGICSNWVLDRKFKTVRDELTVTVLDRNRFHDTEDTQLRTPGRLDLLHHKDENMLTLISAKCVRKVDVVPQSMVLQCDLRTS